MAGADFYCHDPVVFDLETTGASGQVTQIAALAPLTNDRFECKVFFNESKADPECLEKGHYSQKLWAQEALQPWAAREAFSEWLDSHASTRNFSRNGRQYAVAVGMGYNAAEFDRPLLQKWYDAREEFLGIHHRIFDVMHLALWMLPHLASYSLSSVAEHLGVGRSGAHHADVDVDMTADVAAILLGRIGKDMRWVVQRLMEIDERQK